MAATSENNSGPALVEKADSVELGCPVVVSLSAPTAPLEDISASLRCVADPSSSLEGEVVQSSKGIFNISITPQVRGRHDLIVKVKDSEIAGSPFRIFVKLPPSELGKGRIHEIGSFYKIWGMAVNNEQQLMVIETGLPSLLDIPGSKKKKVTIVERDGRKVGVIECDKFASPQAIAQASDGKIFVTGYEILYKFSSEGELLHCEHVHVLSDSVWDVAMEIINDQIYILGHEKQKVKIFDMNCKLVGAIDVKECDLPADIAQGPDGLYVAGNGIYVYECAPNGALIRKLNLTSSPPCSYLKGMSFDPSGLIVASDARKGVFVFTDDGQCVRHITGEMPYPISDDMIGVGYVEEPGRLAIDKDGYVYVHSFRNSIRIYVL